MQFLEFNITVSGLQIDLNWKMIVWKIVELPIVGKRYVCMCIYKKNHSKSRKEKNQQITK